LNTNLVGSDRILATAEAHKCYDLVCAKRQPDAETITRKKEILGDAKKFIFDDTVQAFYVAAVVGQIVQAGKRPSIDEKAREGLILLQHWERQEKRDLRNALEFLVTAEYKVTEPKEILQVVAELAEVGIRKIRDVITQYGEIDDYLSGIVETLRKETAKEGLPLE